MKDITKQKITIDQHNQGHFITRLELHAGCTCIMCNKSRSRLLFEAKKRLRLEQKTYEENRESMREPRLSKPKFSRGSSPTLGSQNYY